MTTEYEAGKPTSGAVKLAPEQLRSIAAALPAGVTPLGGIAVPPGMTFDGGDNSSIVIYAADDGTIHKAVIVQVKTDHYEITSDTVIGTWP